MARYNPETGLLDYSEGANTTDTKSTRRQLDYSDDVHDKISVGGGSSAGTRIFLLILGIISVLSGLTELYNADRINSVGILGRLAGNLLNIDVESIATSYSLLGGSLLISGIILICARNNILGLIASAVFFFSPLSNKIENCPEHLCGELNNMLFISGLFGVLCVGCIIWSLVNDNQNEPSEAPKQRRKNSVSDIDKLAKLHKLKKSGAISQKEFNEEKKKILGN